MPTAKPVPLPVGQVEPDLEAAHSPKRIATGQFAVVYEPDTIWPKIIEKIASGRSLADALRQPGMPSYALAKATLRDNAELRELYEQAKLDRADAMVDELMDLADQPMPEYLQGAERGAWVQHLRVRVDTRKWVAARLNARLYSDRLEIGVEHRISITAALAAAEQRLQIARQQDEFEEIDITPGKATDTPKGDS